LTCRGGCRCGGDHPRSRAAASSVVMQRDPIRRLAVVLGWCCLSTCRSVALRRDHVRRTETRCRSPPPVISTNGLRLARNVGGSFAIRSRLGHLGPPAGILDQFLCSSSTLATLASPSAGCSSPRVDPRELANDSRLADCRQHCGIQCARWRGRCCGRESADRRSRVIFHELSSAQAVGDMSPRVRSGRPVRAIRPGGR
jgi:hypothetical protein